ncbi:hypothetical protein OIU76_000051 [Salix suchowensis]|nr:hypothetical protein OIU76_000051 [Salix suchowensis]
MKEDRVSEDEDNVAGAKSLGFKGANYEKNKNKNKNRGNKRGNKIDNPRLQEFLQVMQPQVKSLLWENDSIVVPTTDLNSGIGKKEVKQRKKIWITSGVKKEWSDYESKNSGSNDEDADNEDEEDDNYGKDEEIDSSNESLQREDIAQAGVSEDTPVEIQEHGIVFSSTMIQYVIYVCFSDVVCKLTCWSSQ